MLSKENKVVLRTTLQTAAGVALVVPQLVDELGLQATTGWVAGVLAVSATLTRFMSSDLGQRLMGALRTDEPTDKK